MRKRSLLIVAIALMVLYGFTIAVMAEDTTPEKPSVEQVESIDGTKSELYYFSETDTYLIYSRKNGVWYELSHIEEEEDEPEEEETPTDADN